MRHGAGGEEEEGRGVDDGKRRVVIERGECRVQRREWRRMNGDKEERDQGLGGLEKSG